MTSEFAKFKKTNKNHNLTQKQIQKERANPSIWSRIQGIRCQCGKLDQETEKKILDSNWCWSSTTDGKESTEDWLTSWEAERGEYETLMETRMCLHEIQIAAKGNECLKTSEECDAQVRRFNCTCQIQESTRIGCAPQTLKPSLLSEGSDQKLKLFLKMIRG